MYSLNLSEDKRILSACVCLNSVEYENVVTTIPDSDISDYKYVDGEYIYDPLPDDEPEEPTTDDILNVLLGV